MRTSRGGPAAQIIRALNMRPHPEGGWYAETWRDHPVGGGRGTGTAIYFLLARGEVSHWHRVDATEIWHFYGGDALELRIWSERQPPQAHTLGPDLQADQRPQVVVPAGAWQSARSLGDYTLAGATVSPAFTFEGFELAPPGWEPPA